MILRKIISGGQTGVDQAALRAARIAGIATGGWCPPGRACDGGTIPTSIPVEETPEDKSTNALSVLHSLRTEWNVRDSDATLMLSPFLFGEQMKQDDPGSYCTIQCAVKMGKQHLESDPDHPDSANIIREWLDTSMIGVLNVAGPSERTAPGIGDKTYKLLLQVFKRSN